MLEAHGISKAFPGVQALKAVNLRLGRGEVLGVVGENGAGKSTLMKILAGVQTADEGEITLDGQAVRIGTVEEAEKRGIVLIHQELNLVNNLDVAGNVFLGREPRWGGPLHFLHRRLLAPPEPTLRRRRLPCSSPPPPRTLPPR